MSHTVTLRLYIMGSIPRSKKIIDRIRKACDTRIGSGGYTLDIKDIHKHPSVAEEDNILAVPTLIRYTPLPVKRIIGDISAEKILTDVLEID
jgi:circadian clock protein KaiB